MKIKIDNKELELHYSFRMMMMYEQIQGKSIDFANMTMQDIVILFYAAVVSTLQYNKVSTLMKYEDFMNWVDDNGGEQAIVDFTNWYIHKVQEQYSLMPEDKNDKPVEETDPNV